MVSDALSHARHLAENGVPIFIAKPDKDQSGHWITDGGHHGTGYWLPRRWQHTEPDPSVVDRWQPGDALVAVMGHVLDLIDVDPRSGGDESINRLRRAGKVPVSYGRAATPSGGTHDFIATLGVRSMDRVLPGLDVKAGTPDGRGRGFAFIAPTVKLSKTTNELVTYVWVIAPSLDELTLIGVDHSGCDFTTMINGRSRSTQYEGPPYDGPAYSDFSQNEKQLADTYVESIVMQWRERLLEAVDWPEGQTDEHSRGWEALSRDSAWALARLAVTPWTSLSPEDAQKAYAGVLPDEMAHNKKCGSKWYDGILEKASVQPVEPPWWLEFLPPPDAPQPSPDAYPDFPAKTDDAYLSAWLAYRGLAREWCWVDNGLGWMRWDGRRWCPRKEEHIREVVRLAVLEVNKEAVSRVAMRKGMDPYLALLSFGRISSISNLMRGAVAVNPDSFDQQPDLLNVGNGVVDLRTGDLLPHDPKYHLTKITEAHYLPAAQSADWAKCLNALEPEVADWMQIRVGQAATGYPTSDDILPIGQGGGSNGKSTFLTALFVALGEHMTLIPEKLIRANPNDHPTELMTLFGARVAVIDETPEVATLNIPRLKQTVGSERLKSRLVHKDNIEWKATHSLFVMTNYIPTILETDHGTWRRLALVRFTKTFQKDDRFRARIASGSSGLREAVLAWVVRGAIRWYANNRVIPEGPPRVLEDTQDWRMDSDLVMGYLHERVVFDKDACVLTRDLLDDLNEWLLRRGQKPWSDRLMVGRLREHTVLKQNSVYRVQHQKASPPENLHLRSGRVEEASTRPVIWVGLRWRDEQYDTDVL